MLCHAKVPPNSSAAAVVNATAVVAIFFLFAIGSLLVSSVQSGKGVRLGVMR